MNKDQKLLEEAYCKIYESLKEPLYFGSEEHKQKWKEWLSIHSLNWKVNQEGSIDVRGSVVLRGERRLNDPFLSLFPLKVLPFQFNSVEGVFECFHNALTTLKGSPQTIGDSFLCSSNSLESLEGGPKVVKGNFTCYNNKLTSLKGSPEIVGESFDVSYNKITSLEGAPKTVGLHFDCTFNNLTSLEGSPKVIKGNFDCSNNDGLQSLVGGPEIVEGDFDCRGAVLTSLKGAPKVIKGQFIGFDFSDQDYRKYASRIEKTDKELSKDFSEEDLNILSDF
jgi:hypothetical protein